MTAAANAQGIAASPKEVYPWVGGIVFFFVFALMVAALGNPNMLRDSTAPAGNPNYKRPYCLGKLQMAWWFLIIVFSYLYILATTGTAPGLSPSQLGLPGISGATGAVSSAITDTKNGKNTFSEHTTLLEDLLNDADGAALHRFQMIAMTIVLGATYVCRVLFDDKLPGDFDGATLGLMGISSGRYLGFKFPENQGTKTPMERSPAITVATIPQCPTALLSTASVPNPAAPNLAAPNA
jgi:hypothetical protein